MMLSFEVDEQVTPRTIKKRVTIEHPTADDVRAALVALSDAGVPDYAVISFNPWNQPSDRYYLVATWIEG